jgi:O-antigen/teichoic acid export membrane protein
MVALDNLLMILGRATYALSAVLVFGWLLADASLAVQLYGFAVSRATLQLADVAVGIWLAKRRIAGLRLNRAAYDPDEYRAVRHTVWHSAHVSLLLNMNPQIMAVLINLFFGLTYNGIWQIVVQFSGYAWMFSEGLLRGISPLTTHLQEGGRRDAVGDLMGRSIRYQLAVALPAVIFLGLFVTPLLELWVGARLAADSRLATAGMTAQAALSLASAMCLVMLAARALRASLSGVENVLYGMGKVRSYAWSSKWATLICVVSATVGMAWWRDPLVAPIALLVSGVLFSPVAVLQAARREAGLPIGATLRQALPGPLAANLLWAAALLLLRRGVDRLTLVGLVGTLAAAALVYAPLVFFLILRSDERSRLAEITRRGLQRGWRTVSSAAQSSRAAEGEAGDHQSPANRDSREQPSAKIKNRPGGAER